MVKVNLFNTELNNQNAVIIGPSGSGKSFTIGHFVAQRFEKGQKQLIIDIGGSYKNLVEALQGQYYEYDLEKPLQFNPFLISKDHNKQYNLNDEKKNFLIALILTVWKGDNVSEVPKEAITVLNIWLELYYNEINESIKEGKDELPTIRGFINWLTAYDKNNTNKEHETHKRYIDINSLLLVISPFTEGKYKDILNYTKTEDLSDYDLVCFDLQKVKNAPAIFNVVAMIITELSLDQIRKYPDRRKYLYMDEAWSLLSNMGEWIETMFRTIRKNNGSINIITQGIEEIIASKIGSAIINNAETRIILNHSGKSEQVFENLQKHLGLTELDVQKLKSVRISQDVKEPYRELFIKQQSVSKIYCLEVPLNEYAVISSKPSERNYLKTLFEKYGNMEYALEQWVETYKNN
ncbi:MAG: hypothetical protein A2491_19445 [Bacteroidetes bacterium RIFOXYC12_FULL_35_7]|nr:MAG: hypothetical protein A2491_19445 [Bacteroidetes bacterium RIFOXYC12_FULL_35_7]